MEQRPEAKQMALGPYLQVRRADLPSLAASEVGGWSTYSWHTLAEVAGCSLSQLGLAWHAQTPVQQTVLQKEPHRGNKQQAQQGVLPQGFSLSIRASTGHFEDDFMPKCRKGPVW